jgi:glutamate-1-semialdehyde 2,1-aminomutase
MDNADTLKQKQLIERARHYLPGGSLGNVTLDSEHDIIIQRGYGSRIWDVSGRSYIDYLMGSGPMVLGHSHPSVVTAVYEAISLGSTFFANNQPSILLAEELVKALPCADKVRFTTSGTDATFQAMRIARAFRQREKILKFEGGFHGTSDYALMSQEPRTLESFPMSQASVAGIPKSIQDLVLIAPFNDADTSTSIIEKYHDDLAGVILEPMQRMLPPSPGFLKSIRDVTSHYGIPLIFDEVVTGFRLAYGGAQTLYGVTPDLTALGKIMGGGYPLGAVCGRQEIMDIYDISKTSYLNHVSQIGTLNGNPIAATAGLATLAELRKEGTYEQLWSTGKQLRESLDKLFLEAEIPAQTSGEDPVFDLMFTLDPLTDYRSTLKANNQIKSIFRNLLQEEGVFQGPQKFYPSLAHNEKDISETINAFENVIDKLAG